MKKLLIISMAFLLHPVSAYCTDQVSQASSASSNASQVAGNNNAIKNSTTYTFNSFAEFNQELIKTMPEKDRSNAEHVVRIAEDLIKASVLKDNKSLKEGIKKQLSDISLLNYQAAKSPFLPPVNKAQYLCNNTILLSYDGYLHHRGKIELYINGNLLSIKPGRRSTPKEAYGNLDITYLEYNKKKKAPIIHYVCPEK